MKYQNPYDVTSAESNATSVPQKSVWVTLVAAISSLVLNEASLYWGCTEWLFWRFPENLPLSIKLWMIGSLAILVIVAIALAAKMKIGSHKPVMLIATLPSAVGFGVLCALGNRSLNYVTEIGFAVLLLQIMLLIHYRRWADTWAAVLVTFGSISGIVLFHFQMMVSSLSA